jgi:hypothetical protein
MTAINGFTTAQENLVLDQSLGAVPYTPPTTWYLALYSVAPTKAGGGTEFSTFGYARKAITNNATNFPAAAGAPKANGVIFSVGPAAGGTWPLPVAWGLHGHISNDDLRFGGPVTGDAATNAANNGDSVSIAIGVMTVSMANT